MFRVKGRGIKQLAAGALRAISENFNKIIRNKKPVLQDRINRIVRNRLFYCPELISLRSDLPGELRSEFGISQTEAVVATETTIRAIQNGIKVEITPVKPNRPGKIAVSVDLTGLKTQNLSTVIKNGSLPYMNWLLEYGDRTIIYDYSISAVGRGRSGVPGIMVGGSGWRVPPQYSGVEGNNFVTRALDGLEEELTNVLNTL